MSSRSLLPVQFVRHPFADTGQTARPQRHSLTSLRYQGALAAIATGRIPSGFSARGQAPAFPLTDHVPKPLAQCIKFGEVGELALLMTSR